MLKLAPLALLLLLGLMGCTKPAAKDFVGTWAMTTTPRYLPPEARKAAGTLVLNADGSFAAAELPVLFWFGENRPPEPTSGTGAWTLEDRGLGPVVELSFHTLQGGRPLDIITRTPITDQDLPYGKGGICVRRAWLVGPRFILYYTDDTEHYLITLEKKPNQGK